MSEAEKLVVGFRVQVDRMQDISLQPGTTVAGFRELLAKSGQDVSDAKVKVIKADGDSLIGSLDHYVLENGDLVEFGTSKCFMPNLADKLASSEDLHQLKDMVDRPQPVTRKAPSVAVREEPFKLSPSDIRERAEMLDRVFADLDPDIAQEFWLTFMADPEDEDYEDDDSGDIDETELLILCRR